MLIIISDKKSSAIDWPSVESFTFEEGEHNKELVINTKSGSICKVINPTDEAGAELNFEAVVSSWLNDYTAWRVIEGKDKTPPPTGMPIQMPRQVPPPLFNCAFCGDELEFGNCTNGHCMSNQ